MLLEPLRLAKAFLASSLPFSLFYLTRQFSRWTLPDKYAQCVLETLCDERGLNLLQ
jgi:hypothetical protein